MYFADSELGPVTEREPPFTELLPVVAERARQIEDCCYQEDDRKLTSEYRQKIRRLSLNVGDVKNPSLRQGVLSGEIGVSRFCGMSNEVGNSLSLLPPLIHDIATGISVR